MPLMHQVAIIGASGFTGAELLQAMVTTGMEFGEMNIFHRIPEGAEKAVADALRVRPDLTDTEVKALVGKGFYLTLAPIIETARAAL